MHISGFLSAISDEFIVSITMNDSLHLGFVGRARAAEAYPNRKRIRQLVDGRVERALCTLRVVVVARACGRHAASIHSTVGDIAIGSDAKDTGREDTDTLRTCGSRSGLRG